VATSLDVTNSIADRRFPDVSSTYSEVARESVALSWNEPVLVAESVLVRDSDVARNRISARRAVSFCVLLSATARRRTSAMEAESLRVRLSEAER
jgi:hypothetical protein